MAERITSTANPRIKALARLKDRRGREEQGRFLIEGHRELRCAHDAGVPIETVVFAPDLATSREHALARRIADGGAAVLEVGVDAFARVSMRRHPDGLAATAIRMIPSLDELRLPPGPLLLVVEGVEKPGNLGAMFRTAAAAGADAVVVAGEHTDLTNPNVIRASQGTLFALRWAVAPTAQVIGWLERHGLRLVAASPEAPRSVWDADLTGAVAIAVGAEAKGLTAALRLPSVTVAIPMTAAVDSLNASVAAAVMLYEAVRQRHEAGH